MKERPILFSGPMVRAILKGRKTQTRRILKQADFSKGMHIGGLWADAVYPARESGWIAWQGQMPPGPALREFSNAVYTHGFPCPYGQPGDRLWVRETWRVEPRELQRGQITNMMDYAADPGSPMLTITGHPDAGRYSDHKVRYRPSIHMPRWASRLTLEITSVRAERLCEISNADAYAEGFGVALCASCNETGFADLEGREACEDCDGEGRCSERDNFHTAWDTMNAKRGYPWSSNPWVWVVEFRRIDP